MWTTSFPQPSHLYMPDHAPREPGSYTLSNSSLCICVRKAAYLYSAMLFSLRSNPIRPSCPSRKGSRVTALFFGHPSRSLCAPDPSATAAQFGHNAGNLGRPRTVMFLWRIGEHFDPVMGKLVEIWFRDVTRTFRWHTLPVLHECVSGSSVQNFKVAHYRRPPRSLQRRSDHPS